MLIKDTTELTRHFKLNLEVGAFILFFLITGCFNKSKNSESNDVQITAAIPLLDDDSSNLSSEETLKWQDDLDYLVTKIKELHPDPFFSGNENEFNDMHKWISNHLHQMNRSQIIISYMRLLALVGVKGKDGHTGLWPYKAPANFHLYPLRLYWFDDGIYVVDAETDSNLIGAQLKAINNVSVKDIFSRIDPFISRDGPMWVRSWAPIHMLSPEFQRTLGFSGKDDYSEFKLELEGKEITLNLKAMPHSEYHERFPMYLWQGILPYNEEVEYLNPRDEYYWLEEWPEKKVLYFQFRAVTSKNKEGKSLNSFVNKMKQLVDTGEIEKIIIDARLNGGGDNTAYKELLNFISNDPFFKQENRLYLLIGRATFSAGINFVTDVELNSNAILVGEPTGGSPNQYGDPEGIVLPNSKVRARISTIYWDKVKGDGIIEHRPNVLIPILSEDYFRNFDRVLDTILK